MSEPTQRQELVQRARAGDGAAFEQLVAPLLGRLLAFVRRAGARVVRGDADEEDVLQVTLHQAWRLLPSYVDHGPESCYRWLVAIARHALGDRRKYLHAKGRGRAANIAPPEDGGWLSLRDPATSIPRAVVHRESCRRILRALEAVPIEQRRVVELHVLEGMSLREIAARLQLSKNATWERLHRGLARMRERLEPQGASS